MEKVNVSGIKQFGRKNIITSPYQNSEVKMDTRIKANLKRTFEFYYSNSNHYLFVLSSNYLCRNYRAFRSLVLFSFHLVFRLNELINLHLIRREIRKDTYLEINNCVLFSLRSRIEVRLEQ